MTSTQGGDEEALLVERARSGDAGAIGELLTIVYGELRAAAQRRLGSESGTWTLQATALANEAYIRLQSRPITGLASARHLLNIAVIVVDRVIVDHVRQRQSLKRGGAWSRVALDPLAVPAVQSYGFERYECVSRALSQLESESPKHAEIARLRYVLGLSVKETAEATGQTEAQVKHYSRFILAWLGDAVQREQS